MISKDVTIINRLGLHARAAAKFVQLASSFSADIHVNKEGRRVNGKSIMGVMMLAASKDSSINITADGEDEDNAITELEALINNRFGEEE